MPATIEIDVEGRWDAGALLERLGPYHAYRIRFAPDRRLVHAQCSGGHGECAEVRFDGRPYAAGTDRKESR